MSAGGGRLPYPGLRSFTREETDLFFGREGCVDDMVDRLAEARFLAVLGASGSGKSSLVKTGLLDALEIGLLHQAGSRWIIADFRPGDRPIHNMAEGLLRATSADPSVPPEEEDVKLLRAFLARGPRSVIEWCEADNLPAGANLLLLVDQFEELFRYGAYAEREEAEAFVALLLESARAPLEEARIYVAITMRSEFLGAAALIDGLAEAINKGLYLTPRMSRDQVREAIVGPAAVCGFTIEPALANRLLNDLTSFAPWEEGDTGHQLERLVRRADQLPLMQHVLNRLWSVAAARGSGPIVLTLADYDQIGGLKGALAAHGREILDELLPEHRETASAVFRALTAGSSLAEAVRRPTEFGELVEIAGGDEIAVREIVEAFRAPGRNFLVPPRPTPLRSTTLIDISHESLIRQWDEFAHWLQREITSADTWRRLVDAADRFKRGEANLLSGLTLASIANWWDTERPTAAWAKRYGGDFIGAAEFLAESRRAEAAEKAKEADERRQKSRNRLVTAAVIVILCIITPLTGFAGYMAWQASQEAERANLEAAAAEVARNNAERERLEAEAAREEAEEQRAAADEQREAANHALEEAERQRLEAETQRREAERQAEVAQEERQRAEEAAALAQAESARADEERRRAEEARSKFQRANLEQFAQRLETLQQDGAWELAADHLGALWREVTGPDPRLRERWMIEPVAKAFARQKLAEYPVYPAFLNYSGYTGWTGTYGRFRIYDLDPKAGVAAASASGNNVMGVFDALTGAVTGTFELPNGLSLGSEIDLVAPDGQRAAIVTSDATADDGIDERQVVLWSAGLAAPLVIPMPALGGDVDLAELAPVHTDGRFAVHFTIDAGPGEIAVADPAAAGTSFRRSAADLALAAGLQSIDSLKLLGLIDNTVVVLVNAASDGRVLAVDVTEGTVTELASGGGITGAALTPDGAMLLTVTCPNLCTDQDLTAFDPRLNLPLWVERIPSGMTLVESGIKETTSGGTPIYSVAVHNKGAGVVFEIPKQYPDQVTRLPAEAATRIDEIAFDGDGGYRTVDSAGDQPALDGVDAAGVLASYRIPVARQKLSYYVAPNSLAVYEDGETVRLAGVSYNGDIEVYRLRDDGTFEGDPNFRKVPVGESDCIAAMGFGGDGNSLLVRHVDGNLQYVATIKNGPNVGWRVPVEAGSGAEIMPEPATPPSVDCEAPATGEGTIRERIVPADRDGRRFALLDKTGNVSWIDIVAAQDGAGTGTAAVSRAIAASVPAGSGVTWIAGDPLHGRAALVSPAAVDIVPHAMAANVATVSPSESGSGPSAGAEESADTASAAKESAADAVATGGGGARADSGVQPRKLPPRGEARAAAFDRTGRLVVAYADGRLALFAEGDGAWSELGDMPIPRAPIDTLIFSGERVILTDERDFALGIDTKTMAVAGFGRAPANPSAFGLHPEGQLLSIEWDTDSVAAVGLAPLPGPAEIDDAARLVGMRSALRDESEPSLDALIIDHEMEMSFNAPQGEASVDCVAAERNYLRGLEARLFGDPLGNAPDAMPSECPSRAGAGSFDVLETLARRAQTASLRQLAEEGAFSPVLQAAQGGDKPALRILGAVLIDMELARGDLDHQAVARDAVRFGASIPSAVLKAIAAGAPLEPSLADLARERAGSDPTLHQLAAHVEERRINDLDALAEALFEFSLAERLYREQGRGEEAGFAAQRRSQLARVLPDGLVLSVLSRVEAWAPPPAEPGGAAVASEPPAAGSDRHEADTLALDSLEASIPDSPLLAALRLALDHAFILDLRRSDPETAASMLIDLGRRATADAAWSPERAREYLSLAEDLSGDAAESAFQLAAEALAMIGTSFKTPIHADVEASELFRRAADIIAANVGAVPREAAASAMEAIDLSLLKYTYNTLPGIGAADAATAEQVLESAARMAAAVAASSDEPGRWSWLEGESLFWQGVLVNDHDPVLAATTLRQSADKLRPLVDSGFSDPAYRFRLAEALRWVGLAQPSNADTEAVEREAAERYRALWEERGSLDPALLSDIGVGYGFALANLAQTIREATLVDVNDGRGAEDHLGWFFDVLKLAAEKDEVNDTMIEIGAAAGDSGFVGGWYGMSSFGWSMGFLSGLVNVESGTETVTQCDVLAADPYDPGRRAPGLILDQVDIAQAETVCRAETILHSGDAHALYQLARVISSDMTREAEFMPVARNAAEQGSSSAFALIAYALSEKKDDRSNSTYVAAAQRTILESFPILFPFLEKHAKSEDDRVGLTWYARRAGDLGMPEAQLALAKLANEPRQKFFHAKLAARLFSEQGNAQAAAGATRLATAIFMPQAEADQVDAEVAAWTAESLIELPADVGAS